MRVYKGRTFADKAAIMPGQVRRKVQYMVSRGEHLTINCASIILAALCGVLLGLRRSEHFASAERSPNKTTLLRFSNLARGLVEFGRWHESLEYRKMDT